MHLYLLPAAERAEEFRRDHGGGSPVDRTAGKLAGRPARGGSGPDHPPGTPGHRKQVVEQAFMGVMGMKRKQAEALYDRQLAEWQAQQGGGS